MIKLGASTGMTWHHRGAFRQTRHLETRAVVMSFDSTDPPDRISVRAAVWAAARMTGAIAVLVALYYLMPLDRSSVSLTMTILLIGLAGFVALVAVQVTFIVRSHHPALRAVTALVTSVLFFLLLFAGTYVALATLSPSSFGRHLSHTDGFYFTVTVFSTVGFGDITAKSETARLVVTAQMIADLVIYGVALKVFVRAARRGQQRRVDSTGR